MAKEKGRKFKKKGKKVGQPNAIIKKANILNVGPTKTIVPAPPPPPPPVADPAEATASDPAGKNIGGASQGKVKEREKAKRLAGFIFMCNPSTKLECYRYRVFGLPSGKKEVVEQIKPGAKLFLFDFESKLLYGIYEATSAGKVNLEPAAFKGKFSAQVKFKIFKECLPLPESSLRHVIKENYTGLKFKQELSGKQVRKLLSSFRPLTASLSQPAPQALPNASLLHAMPPSATENRFRHTGRLPAIEVPYLAELQNGRTPASDQQHGYHRSAAYMERRDPTLDHRSLQTSGYYVPDPQQPSFTRGVAHGVQEPFYSRYRTIEERASHDQVTSLEMRYRTVEARAPYDQVTGLEGRYLHQLPLQREALYQGNVAASNSNLAAQAQYTSSVTQQQPQIPAPYHHMPLQRSTQYEDSLVAYNSNPAAPRQYTTALVSQPQVPATYHQIPLQRSTQYDDSVIAYNSNPAAPAQYTTALVSLPQVPATYHQVNLQRDNVIAYDSYSAASAWYASSVMRPQEVAPGVAAQPSVPITSYYSYTAANR